MTEHTNRTRVQAGVSAGGQFATEPKTEPGIALTVPPHVERERLLTVRDEAAERAEALTRLPGAGDPAVRHRAELRAVAATVRAAYPAAVSFTIEESDQAGSESGYVGSVLDGDGNDLTGGYGAEYGEDEYGEDITADMLWDVQATFRGQVPCMSFEGSDRMGYTRIVDIDGALDGAAVPDADVAQDAAERGQGLVVHHSAHHGRIKDTPEQQVQAVLGDLAAYAEREGLDLQRLLDDATKQAQRASGNTVRPSAAEAIERIERERPCLDADTSDAELAQWARRSIIPALESSGHL